MLRKLIRWAYKSHLKELEAQVLAKYEEKLRQAEEVINTASRRNFTCLENCDVDSVQYLKVCKDIWETPTFQWELLNVKNVLTDSLIKGTPEKATIIQGMFKGVDVLAAAFQGKAAKYYQLQEEKNAKAEIQYQRSEAQAGI